MEEIIKEIAERNDTGEVVFLHKQTHEILSYPAPDRSGYNEYDYLAEEVLAITDAAPDLYIQFDPPDTRESYKIMEGFVETLQNEKLKVLLLGSLNSKKPFRNFRNAIEIEGIEDGWYDYKDAYMQMSVRDKL
ncbi:MAG: hypothetical protein H7246_00625 [Phycisphaerae bacterium]|nr:hypothetical protein [Saprospiraceae bacterium]